MIFAHTGALAPHDVYGAWNGNALLVAGFVLAAWAYSRGRARARSHAARAGRDRCFYGALAALAVAILSPLDAMAHALASAHMIQHILLVLVAAPLLALSEPAATVLRGAPAAVRSGARAWRQRLRLTTRATRLLRAPAAAWLLHAGTLWFWHGVIPYDAALEHSLLHVVEHATFLVTGVVFWRVVIRSRRSREVSAGLGVLLVFGMAIQSGFLSALLTFARSPWYTGYAATTAAWNLEPLADQQLAGVIMWIPAGFVYLAAALTLLSAWIAGPEEAGGRVAR